MNQGEQERSSDLAVTKVNSLRFCGIQFINVERLSGAGSGQGEGPCRGHASQAHTTHWDVHLIFCHLQREDLEPVTSLLLCPSVRC